MGKHHFQPNWAEEFDGGGDLNLHGVTKCSQICEH